MKAIGIPNISIPKVFVNKRRTRKPKKKRKLKIKESKNLKSNTKIGRSRASKNHTIMMSCMGGEEELIITPVTNCTGKWWRSAR